MLKTRAALAQAVVDLASEKGFADVTIAEIASRAGVGYATFFRHYPDKQALLADVAETLIGELSAAILPAVMNVDTAAASLAICRYIDAHRPICRAMLAGDAEADIRRFVLERAIAHSRTLGAPHASGLPDSLVVVHAVTATLGLLAWWLDQGSDLDAEAMSALLDRLVLIPIQKG